MVLDVETAKNAFDELGQQVFLNSQFGLDTRQTLALGMIQIANAHMERALRVISVERGEDPRETVLVSFGGAGGLHACDLARALGVPYVLVSPMAATLSALGMLVADVQLDYVHTIMLRDEVPFEILEQQTIAMVRQGEEDLQREGVAPEQAVITQTVDVRYVGQSFDLNVPLNPQFRQEFDRIHQERYGYHQQDARIEIVNVRVRAIGRVTPPSLTSSPVGPSDASSAKGEERLVVLNNGIQAVPHYWGNRLRPGHEVSGPAILVLDDTTVYLGPDDLAKIDAYSNILIDIGAIDG
jgi:N-methylhydantoinase A/oxoprolinase/acetone carboxylase beta subunit